MLKIGEKLNSSIPKTLEALKNHDEAYLIDLIRRQEECGADYLDINTALTGEAELADMEWVIDLAKKHSGCGIMIDSPNPEIIRDAVSFAGDRKLFINSITLDGKYETLYDMIREKQASVICLPMTGRGIPETAEQRVANAQRLAERLTAAGIPEEHIYIDALVEAVATAPQAPAVTLETIRLLKEQTSVKAVCGLSNVSFGLPGRVRLNASFLAMCMQAGADALILDPTSVRMQEALYTAEALLGRDEYCLEYINYSRYCAK